MHNCTLTLSFIWGYCRTCLMLNDSVDSCWARMGLFMGSQGVYLINEHWGFTSRMCSQGVDLINEHSGGTLRAWIPRVFIS